MKYGMNLLLWSGNMGEEIYPVFEKLKEMGYDGVELPIFDLKPGRYEAIGRNLEGWELESLAVPSLDPVTIGPSGIIATATTKPV